MARSVNTTQNTAITPFMPSPGFDHGYDVSVTPEIFPAPTFRLVRRKTFQLGLNNFFIFERTDAK